LYLNFEWPLRNLNAKNIFFHGDQREEIFLDIPSRYGNKGTIMKVAKSGGQSMAETSLREHGVTDPRA
jgi:hypothetical protein